MSIVLFRVDERLIHGQVVVGWGGPLNADRMIVVDDELAQSPWEQELYSLGVPQEMDAQFATVAQARRDLADWRVASRRAVVLVRNLDTLRRVAEGGLLQGQQVNLGGIHHAAGRRRVLPYLFVAADEERVLKQLADEGLALSAQDLPGSRAFSLQQLLSD